MYNFNDNFMSSARVLASVKNVPHARLPYVKYPLLTLPYFLSRALFQCPRCYETVLDLDVINELLCASAHGKYCVKFDEHFYVPLQRAMTGKNPVKLICMRLIHVHVYM